MPIVATPRVEMIANAVVEREPSPFDCLHHERGRRKDLGQGGKIEDAIPGRCSRLIVKRQAAKRLVPQRARGIANFDRNCGKSTRLNGV